MINSLRYKAMSTTTGNLVVLPLWRAHQKRGLPHDLACHSGDGLGGKLAKPSSAPELSRQLRLQRAAYCLVSPRLLVVLLVGWQLEHLLPNPLARLPSKAAVDLYRKSRKLVARVLVVLAALATSGRLACTPC